MPSSAAPLVWLCCYFCICVVFGGGSLRMESYEEFCQRSLAILQAEGQAMRTVGVPHPSQDPHSTIRFHGRAVLPPLLREEQRREMADHRQKAVQLEVDRQTLKRSNLLIRVQNILDHVQMHKVPDVEIKQLPPTPQYSSAPKPETVNGYTLVTDPPEFPRGGGARAGVGERPITPHPEHPPIHLNGYGGEMEVGERNELDGSLESLLRRSREYVEKERGQKGSKVTGRMVQTTPPPPPPESLSDKENEGRSLLGETSVERGSILRPLSPHQTQNQTQNMSHYQTQTNAQYQAGCDSHDRQSCCLSPSPSDLFASLPSPEPSLSPRPHRRRPRPVSAGNIHISFPIGPADLIPRGLGRSGEGGAMATWEEASTGGLRIPDHWGLVGSSGGSGNSSRRSSHCATSPVRETSSPVNGHVPGALAHDILSSGFRRRCHTLDSHLHSSSPPPAPDRSQERLPRFMGGVPRLAPSRRPTTAPLNQSYEVENPAPSLPRPHVTSDLSLGHVRMRLEAEGTKGPQDGRQTPVALSHTLEEQDKTEETQRRMQALGDMQRRLEEEHVLQMSLLIAEQAKEQQRLHQELEVKERSHRQQVCDRRSGIDSYPAVSPVCPNLSPAQSPADRSPGHSFPSPLSSGVSSPSLQTPVYLWGPTWGSSKARGRLSQAMTSGQQRALFRLAAITRGFLTRRLLQTEKVKHLRQTVQDTQEFIRSFQTEAPQKRGPITPQDLSLQERVRAQLRAARYDVHDIFFEMPLEERLALLQQDRDVRTERKLREMEKAKSPKERMTLSAATQRSLDRKKSSSRVGESPGPARKLHQKPKSPPANRILKPSQGQNAPVPGQLNRQGSWYRKTPEERVRRSDSMKKHHSLG
ncbi:centriolar coiled-coil protein of 110 kDa-like isoform X2 [Osmerus eperlanus]|uniref:centriolar coiled-coil protein of 110 kDa-like isoform X2 n=1 Tax=Osmerus eperlanus TaxID=29151 RepID=UPI002E0F4077